MLKLSNLHALWGSEEKIRNTSLPYAYSLIIVRRRYLVAYENILWTLIKKCVNCHGILSIV